MLIVILSTNTPSWPYSAYAEDHALPLVFISKKSSLGIHPNNNFSFLSIQERGCFSTLGGNILITHGEENKDEFYYF